MIICCTVTTEKILQDFLSKCEPTFALLDYWKCLTAHKPFLSKCEPTVALLDFWKCLTAHKHFLSKCEPTVALPDFWKCLTAHKHSIRDITCIFLLQQMVILSLLVYVFRACIKVPRFKAYLVSNKNTYSYQNEMWQFFHSFLKQLRSSQGDSMTGKVSHPVF
jgi:hypothetical protein